MYQYVKTYIENGAGYIILNDPKKLNALSQPMAAELSEVLEQFRFDPQIRVIVLRGEGGRFCAGGDITSMKKRVDCYAAGIPAPTQTKTNMANFNHLVLYIRQIEKPVVAWIEGACAGGGMSLAMACDFAIAEENTKMSFAFSSIGLAPDMGSSVLLTRRVGPARAADLFMTGRRFTGKEAAETFLREVVDKTYEMYHKPIWITEFAVYGWPHNDVEHIESVKEFMKTAIDGLNA